MSLGTFLVGLAAVRYLPLEVLGTYALAFVAFLLAGNVSGVLIYTPAEVLAVASAEGRARLGILRSSLRLGLPIGLPAALVVAGGVVVVPSTTSVEDRVVVAISLVGFASLSPAQDHLRRMFHAAGRSWDACSVSAVRFVVISLALAVLLAGDQADSTAAPFGVLTLATVVSGVWGLHRARPRSQRAIRLTWRRARAQGGLLVVGSVAGFATGFAVTAVVTAASGAAAVAQVEAVRLVSQPVTVVVIGLLSVLGPRVMAAAAAGDRTGTRRELRRPAMVTIGLTALWVAVLSAPGTSRVVEIAVPRAYDVPWLLQVMVLAQSLAYGVSLWRVVLLARVYTRSLLGIDLLLAFLSLVIVLALRDQGPWALVLANLVSAALGVLVCAGVAAAVMRRSDGVPSQDRQDSRAGLDYPPPEPARS